MRVSRTVIPAFVISALLIALPLFLAVGCGSDSGTSPDSDSASETMEFEIVDGGLPITDSEWRDINDAYEQAHMTYVQAVIAIGSLSHMDPASTSFDDFDARRTAVDDALTAMEDASEDLDAIIGPYETQYGDVQDAVAAKIAAGEPVVCGENTVAVIKRLGRIARENPAKADQARRALVKLGAMSQGEYEAAKKEEKLYTELMDYASKVRVGAKLSLCTVTMIATGGISNVYLAGTSIVTNTISFTDGMMTYSNEQGEIHYNSTDKIELPFILSKGSALVGVLTGNFEDAAANIVIEFGDDIADIANKAIKMVIDRDTKKVKLDVTSKGVATVDPTTSALPPVVPGSYLTTPGTKGVTTTVGTPTGESKKLIDTIEAKVKTDLKAGLADFEPEPIIISITPEYTETTPDESVSLSASVTGPAPSSLTYIWEFDDGSGPYTETDGSIAYSYSEEGEYVVTVDVYDGTTDEYLGGGYADVIVAGVDNDFLERLHEQTSMRISMEASAGDNWAEIYINTYPFLADENEFPLVWDGMSFESSGSYSETYTDYSEQYSFQVSGTFAADGTSLTSLSAYMSKIQSGFGGITQTTVQNITMASVPLDDPGWPDVSSESSEIGSWVVSASGHTTLTDGVDTETDS
jgi:hypothetical protein